MSGDVCLLLLNPTANKQVSVNLSCVLTLEWCLTCECEYLKTVLTERVYQPSVMRCMAAEGRGQQIR